MEKQLVKHIRHKCGLEVTTMLDINFENISEVKRLCLYAKSEFIAHKIISSLADYYEGSGVEIKDEIDLHSIIQAEIQVCLSELAIWLYTGRYNIYVVF